MSNTSLRKGERFYKNTVWIFNGKNCQFQNYSSNPSLKGWKQEHGLNI